VTWVQDAVGPLRLPHVLEAIGRIAACYGLTVSNVFHAATATCIPTSRSTDACRPQARVEQASGEIMAACIAAAVRSR